MSVKIYHCKECGRTLLTIKEGTKDEFPMKELKAFAVEGAREKHIPVFEVKDGIVDVNLGSTEQNDPKLMQWERKLLDETAENFV